MIKLRVVRVKASFPYAIEAEVDGNKRYRGYRYAREAVDNLHEWEYSASKGVSYFMRDFNHNFNLAEELGIREVL